MNEVNLDTWKELVIKEQERIIKEQNSVNTKLTQLTTLFFGAVLVMLVALAGMVVSTVLIYIQISHESKQENPIINISVPSK